MNDIKLQENSLKYLGGLLSSYKDMKDLPPVLSGRVIVHMYASRDTCGVDGEFEGFVDALFFDAHIYSCAKNERYTEEQCDNVYFGFPVMVRIFKDGSTNVIIDVPKHKILKVHCSSQSVSFYMEEK